MKAKDLKQIIACILLFWGLLLTGCSNSDDAKLLAEDFFEKVIDKKYREAANMIDPQSKLYPKRFEIVRKLKTDKHLGTLHSTGGGPMAYYTRTVSNLSFTTVDFSEKLNYDSTYTMVKVQLIDRGRGFRISKIYR